MPDPEQTPASRFLSLKWKAVLVFSLVLVTINVSLAGLAYLGLQRQFAQQREQVYFGHIKKIQGLIKNSYQRMEQLADIVPLLRGDNPEENSLAGEIRSIFERHGHLLQMVWGVEVAVFYSSDNKLLVSWGQQISEDHVWEWVQAANKRERPVTGLDCERRCIQYVAVPLLADNERAGVLLLGRSLADMVLSFRQISGDDIGIMTAVQLPFGSVAEPRQLMPEWDMRMVALTNAERNLLVLRSLSEEYSLAMVASRHVWHHHAGREYEIRLIPINKAGVENREAQLVVISDVTRALADIRLATRRSLLGGLVGLVVSEILLLFLLWKPMARLQRVVLSLPYLAENAFEKVRKRLSHSVQPAWGRDEIDVLNNTAMTLSYQLEALQAQIQERTRHLAERGDDLARERDFVTGLLNTAQVIILTQDSAGRVTMLNRQGQRIIGYSADEITGRPFCELLTGDKVSPELFQQLEELRLGRRGQVCVDTGIQCRDGSQRIISWFHSRLAVHPSRDAVVLSVGHDVTEREQAEQRLAWLADHDPLTELFNRRRFQYEFERILRASIRHGYRGGLLYFDLDQFKYINDTSGHQAGDALLRMVADKLRQVVRGSDVVARLGGDEFAVVICECDVEGVLQIAQNICNQLSILEFSARGGNHSISLSIGIALFPLHGATIRDLMANADVAMYQAKEEGRGRWHLFSSDEQVRERMQQRVYWKEQIEQALREDRFLLYFQPVLDIRTHTIGHYEVLLRMRDHRGRIISPAQFIPVAEQSGLIHAIDHLVLRKAITQQAKLWSQGYHLTLSINLSGRVVDDPELVPILEDLLRTTGVNPSSLMFEVTETAAVADLVAAERFMYRIKAHGCRFAVDDFGVGFSSFFYLKRLPVDYVKIDGMFVRELAKSHQDQVFVKALSEVARGLGKKAVAEFVEDAEALALLHEYGVDYAQGHYIGRPTPHIAETPCSEGKVAWFHAQ
ncbi:bifunctional diguanylate cyclase/phosphodiesterase [Nitrosococcus watsonii]|uniref:Diguanylate cyclase/phosphodiesterase with PAS/PAC sensor(S) n=1 Tax=Nitrosococcus watsoni (strain C-113) TaxID=105559 RepID=D8KAV9_NITWC|nr:EAL domain-containing protein [Nitrosococcus watsonii]ADJ29536.1 diguanylate cyclase/phosphodiesterase with PAS/PAC sensor(s) [Nitrosococcus watsonii C-113]